jgi:two-component system OmpR family response regulator
MGLLLIEPDPEQAVRLTGVLEAAGYAVEVIASPFIGEARACAAAFDLIVVDEHRPRVDGCALVRRLRAAGLACPVLLLRAAEDAPREVEGLGAGADDALPRTVSPDVLLARLRVLSRIRRRAWAW